jgi:hypothetical protein
MAAAPIPCPRCGSHGLPSCHICRGSGVASWSSTPATRAPRFGGDDVSKPIPTGPVFPPLRAVEAPAARHSDPETSQAAALSITELAQRASKDRVLTMLFELGPMHDYALIEKYEALRIERGWPHASRSGLQTRRHELVVEGKVEDSGRRIRLRSGRDAIVWQVRQ